MPSSPNYKRKYDQERKTHLARGEDEANRKRVALRREAIKAGVVSRGDGKDLDHKVPLSKGGANTLSNARATDPTSNRSFARNSDGSMKSQRGKKDK